MCTDTQQKEVNRSRLVNIVNRLNKQNSGLIDEINTLTNQNAILKSEIEEITENCSSESILATVELGSLQITNVELKNQVRLNHLCIKQISSNFFFTKVELYEKLNKVQQTELRSRGGIIEKMSKMLRSYHMLVKGLGHMTDSMSNDFDDLVKQVQAPNSVYWDDDVVDSGISSGDSVTTVLEEGENGVRTKRKLIESIESSTSSLDKTFTLPISKPKTMTVRAEQLMAKGGLIHAYISVVAVEFLQCMFTTCVVRNK